MDIASVFQYINRSPADQLGIVSGALGLGLMVLAKILQIRKSHIGEPRCKSRGPPSNQQWPLSLPLLKLSRNDIWDLAAACQGMFVTGATGSGKTTGVAAAVAMAFLRNGFGGLVLVCKNTELAAWRKYCELTGRLHDLIVFDGSGKHRFAFLDEELSRPGEGAGLTENIVALLFQILEIAQRQGSQGGGGRDGERYWAQALKQLIRNAVDLLILAKGRVTVPDLYRVIVSAPQSLADLASDAWKKGSFCFECLREADAQHKSARAINDFKLVADYFAAEFPALSDRTRSVIVSSFTSMVDVLQRSLLGELFSTYTTVRPEDTLNGKIIVVNLPVKEFNEVGLFAAVLWKASWQKAVERRIVANNSRPVFLFADEFQHFSTKYDQEFQATARSSRAATVYLTQNYSGLLAAFDGQQAKAVADSLTANLTTKVWCANSDPVTNEWCASIIGRSRQIFINGSRSLAATDWLSLTGLAAAPDGNAGFSESMEHEVEPRRFTTLRSGGPQNNWIVDTIFFMGGKRFSNGKSWLPLSFRQQF